MTKRLYESWLAKLNFEDKLELSTESTLGTKIEAIKAMFGTKLPQDTMKPLEVRLQLTFPESNNT
jgi:hypothetical protein